MLIIASGKSGELNEKLYENAKSEIEPEALADFRLNDSGDRLAPFDVALFFGSVCHWLSQLHPGIRMQLGKAGEPE